MAGLVPAIHDLLDGYEKIWMARDEHGHDGCEKWRTPSIVMPAFVAGVHI